MGFDRKPIDAMRHPQKFEKPGSINDVTKRPDRPSARESITGAAMRGLKSLFKVRR